MTDRTVTFDSEMTRTGANTTGVVVPPEVIAKLGGGARPAVVAKVNDYIYRTTVGSMRGLSMLPFSAQHRSASGINGGDAIMVVLSIDTESREAELPEDLVDALTAGGVLDRFKSQAPSRQRADVDAVVTAKAVETRERRITAIVAKLLS